MSLGITASFNWELLMDYVYTYNIHIIFGNLIFFYFHHLFSNRRHKKTEDELIKIQIRAEIRQAYKDYKDIPVIDFETTIKYLLALDKKKKELGINSYTDEMMNELISKIKL